MHVNLGRHGQRSSATPRPANTDERRRVELHFDAKRRNLDFCTRSMAVWRTGGTPALHCPHLDVGESVSRIVVSEKFEALCRWIAAQSPPGPQLPAFRIVGTRCHG